MASASRASGRRAPSVALLLAAVALAVATAAGDVETADGAATCGGGGEVHPAPVPPSELTGQLLADMRTDPFVYAVLVVSEGDASAAAERHAPELSGALRAAGIEMAVARSGGGGVESLFAKRYAATLPLPALFLFEDAGAAASAAAPPPAARPVLVSLHFESVAGWAAEVEARAGRLSLEPPGGLCAAPGAIPRRLLKRGGEAQPGELPPAGDSDGSGGGGRREEGEEAVVDLDEL